MILLLAGCKKPPENAGTPEPQTADNVVRFTANAPQLAALNVEPVSARQSPPLALAGRLIWDEDATVRVFSPFAGRISSVHVQINQQVKKGEILAEILSPDFGQAIADARKAESDFRRAERVLNRARDLAEHGAAPKKDVESAEADFESAKSEKERASTRLTIYNASESAIGNFFLLHSPVDGVVVEKTVNPGQEVRPDQMLANMPQFTAPLFLITDPSRLWVQIDATEMELAQLQPGQQFTFTTRAFPNEKFTGKIESVSEFLDPVTRTVKVRGSFDNSKRALKAEMLVDVMPPQTETRSATVPAKAVFLKGDKHYVFLEQHPGEFARREVKTGAQDGGRITIVAGLEPGQFVVTEGCLLLQQFLK
jgi:cobalt-zinc-cadmium efflux system membrane fusion protein